MWCDRTNNRTLPYGLSAFFVLLLFLMGTDVVWANKQPNSVLWSLGFLCLAVNPYGNWYDMSEQTTQPCLMVFGLSLPCCYSLWELMCERTNNPTLPYGLSAFFVLLLFLMGTDVVWANKQPISVLWSLGFLRLAVIPYGNWCGVSEQTTVLWTRTELTTDLSETDIDWFK